MIRTQVQLTEEQHRALKRLAHEQGTSLAALVRRSVDELIRSLDRRDELLRRRANEVVGKFQDDRGDVSERHDEYFASSAAEDFE